MFAPRQVSVQRTIKRYIGKGEGKRGRFVPLDVLLDTKNNEKNFESLKSKFDSWASYDGSGDKPVLFERSK